MPLALVTQQIIAPHTEMREGTRGEKVGGVLCFPTDLQM